MRHLTALLTLAALAAACRHPTIPPTASLVSDEEIAVTGVGLIDAHASWPIREDQIYPQARVRAFEQALRDAQSQMLAAIADIPVGSDDVRMGDMMAQHESVRLLTEDFVDAMPSEPPRWLWEEGVVELDLRLRMGDFQGFLSELPHGYLATTQPGVWISTLDVSTDLPPPAPAPEPAPEPEPLPEATEAASPEPLAEPLDETFIAPAAEPIAPPTPDE